MTRYPIVLEVKPTENGPQVHASTSIELALEKVTSLQSELRCIELDYAITLTAIKEALRLASSRRSRDPRTYWFAGMCIAQFTARLESHGFYLVGKNTTPAEHLATSRASIEKMIAFYHRYPDPFKIDISIPWTKYRDNKERETAPPKSACSVDPKG